MPQISPMNWGLLILTFIIVTTTVMASLPTFQMESMKTSKATKKYKTLP
uniref:ATP synthase F0 subunit 8 n=1 Tax=Paraleius leontonychus TaxID=1807943 RepID=A0A330JGL1_9ACAR|nr:ATP synthase F0 subunit 8 [Paraleius leontonychus]